jgi:hypothetical protein
MRYIKFWANMLLIPIYFILHVICGIKQAIRDALIETLEAYQITKRVYGIK